MTVLPTEIRDGGGSNPPKSSPAGVGTLVDGGVPVVETRVSTTQAEVVPRPGLRATSATRPGLTEQILAVVLLLVLYHETPNAWLLTLSDRELDYSNPTSVITLLTLVGIAFSRVWGLLDQLIAVVRLEPMVVLFTGLALFSVLWSADPMATVSSSGVFVAVALFSVYLVLRFSLQEIVRIFAFMFTVSGLINLYVIQVYPHVGIDRHGRLDGVFGQKNALGYVAAMALPTLLLAARSSGKWRWVFYPSAGLQTYLLLGSESKTMMLAGLGTMLLLIVYVAFRGRRTLPGAVGVGLVGGGSMALAFATANLAMLAQWLDKDVTLTGRVPLWEGMIPIIKERILFGHGFGAAFNGYFSPVHEVLIQAQWEPGDSHNAVIQIWLEMGLLGVVLFLGGYLRGVTRSVKVAKFVPGAIGLWPLSILTFGMFISVTESGIHSDSMGWCVYLVAIFSCSGHLKYRSDHGLSNSLRESGVPIVIR